MAEVKKILIFGGTGFVGYHLSKALLRKKFKVFSVSKKRVKKKRKLKKVNYIYFDATKFSNFKKLKQNFNIIINTAGYGDHLKGAQGKKLYVQHISLANNIIKYFEKKKIEKLIHIGTSFEYDRSFKPIKENFKTLPKSYYGKAKLYVTKLFLKYYKKKKIPVTIFRLFQVYGPKQDSNRLIPYVINGLKKNKKIFLTSGKQLRDFCFIDDAVSAIIISIKKKKTNGQIINLGLGKKISVYNLVKKIFNIIKKGKIEFNSKQAHIGERKIILANIQKAKRLLKWKPKTSLDLGLRKTIKTF